MKLGKTFVRFAWFAGAFPLVFASLGCGDEGPATQVVVPPADELKVEKIVVGKLLFFDTNLSTPPGQACASCHDPEAGFAEPDAELAVSQGVLMWLVGNRNAPTAAYASLSPAFRYDETEGAYVGGQFWDGRAATLVDQAKGPFLNPVEMHNENRAAVIAAVEASAYADLFERVFGKGIFATPDAAYDKVAEALAEFESGAEVNRFTSKFDFVAQGKAMFTDAEARGKSLFETKGKCADCHTSKPASDGKPPVFTDFTYSNLGVPRNPSLPFYAMPPEYNPDGDKFIDRGLGPIVGKPSEDGKFKVPTLRNIGKTAPYMHNGAFVTLREVVEFYNTRDVKPQLGPPEVAENVNTTDLGNLLLNEQDVDDLIAFMMTLTDGYVPPGK